MGDWSYKTRKPRTVLTEEQREINRAHHREYMRTWRRRRGVCPVRGRPRNPKRPLTANDIKRLEMWKDYWEG